MKDVELEIMQALRRRLNWNKGVDAKSLSTCEHSIIDEFDSQFSNLKKKISYRDKIIAKSRETISNHKATIAAKEMLSLFRDSIHRRKVDGCSDELKAEFRGRLDELLDRDVVLKVKKHQGIFDKFREGLSKHRENIFTFLTRPDVPADNNGSERSLRPVKTKLKVSGQFKSIECAQHMRLFNPSFRLLASAVKIRSRRCLSSRSCRG